MKRIITGLALTLLLFSQSALSADITFQGKVIDAETLKPIVGAVVVAVWREKMATPAGAHSRYKDAKETLTDENGDWSIAGPEGDTDHMDYYASWLLKKYYLHEPYFVIYKPGYWGYGMCTPPGGFCAYPCVIKEQGLEGIVLKRWGNSREELEKYNKKYRDGSLPFIPAQDPERKLRELDFSFRYNGNEKRIGYGIADKGMKKFWVYTVSGLKRAITKKDRLLAMNFVVGKELPFLSKMEEEERKLLRGPGWEE